MEKKVSLDAVLHYQNDALIIEHHKKSGIPIEEVKELFVDLKKWLWLCNDKSDDEVKLAMYLEQAAIDNFWHTFILSTKDYHEFCYKYFGYYIHHTPTPDGMNGASPELAQQDFNAFVKQSQDVLAKLILEVCNKLGQDTARRWFQEIPKRYGKS